MLPKFCAILGYFIYCSENIGLVLNLKSSLEINAKIMQYLFLCILVIFILRTLINTGVGIRNM